MKHTINVSVLIIGLGVGIASAQSLGEYARTVRKNKPEASSSTRHFDNDNLPTTDGLSVVGPAPAGDAKAPTETAAGDASANAANGAPANAAAQQKNADELKTRLADQKAKIQSLTRELDLDQRELRLRAAAVYSDPAVRGRNAAEWDKEDLRYKDEIEAKQKALDAANQQFDEIQEQARKAGLSDSVSAADSSNSKDK